MFHHAPEDNSETEEDESEIVPAPIVSGEIRTDFTNCKDETFKTIDDLVYQRFRTMQDGDTAAYPSEPSFRSDSIARDTVSSSSRWTGFVAGSFREAFWKVVKWGTDFISMAALRSQQSHRRFCKPRQSSLRKFFRTWQVKSCLWVNFPGLF